MSASLAVQPAYRASKSEKTTANPDRTIFGTTLDNYGKCWNLLQDSKAIQAASDLRSSKLKWKKRSPTPQRMVDKAWGLRDYRQPEIGEEFGREYYKFSDKYLSDNFDKSAEKRLPLKESVHEIASRSGSRACFSNTSVEDQENRFCKSALASADVEKPIPQRFFSAQTNSSICNHNSLKQRPMSQPPQGNRAQAGASKIQVPKFRLPPGTTNFMKVASLKITETGAKDLLNAEPMNKVGLGDTLQYDYQAFQRQQSPQFYKHNGHVLLLGQRFTDDTTNGQVTAPGGFYKLSTPQRNFNERFRYVQDRQAETTMTHHYRKKQKGKHQTHEKHENIWSEKFDIAEEEVPLNILHKYGKESVSKVLKENKNELIEALKKPTDLRNTALVPPRMNVKELNHPIDPPPCYFTHFGENLKYDKFEGGLHLYIK